MILLATYQRKLVISNMLPPYGIFVASFSIVSNLCVKLGNSICLFLPVAKRNKYVLRDIGHGLLVDHVTSELHKRTFINRIIFSDHYQFIFFCSDFTVFIM